MAVLLRSNSLLTVYRKTDPNPLPSIVDMINQSGIGFTLEHLQIAQQKQLPETIIKAIKKRL